jgi:uncharacterized Tic20 family protein
MTESCPRCGAKLEPDARYCSKCGEAIGERVETDRPAAVQADDGDERMWATLVHLAGFAIIFPIPFANIVGPLIIWLFKRSESTLVDEHGKAALNFQISFTIYFLVLGVVLVISAIMGLFLVGIPFLIATVLLFVACGVTWTVMTIVAAVRAGSGRDPEYILSIPIIR